MIVLTTDTVNFVEKRFSASFETSPKPKVTNKKLNIPPKPDERDLPDVAKILRHFISHIYLALRK